MSTLQQVAVESAAYSKKLSTLKDLPLVANTTSPVPADVAAYYATNIALGSGPNGTFLTTDFFGSAAGMPYNEDFATVTSTITAQLNNGNLSALNTIYSQMVSMLSGTYGLPPTITIPSGPAAGIYASYNAALAALITAADAAIGTAISAMGSATATLNTAWTEMAKHSVNEGTFQSLASIDFGSLTAGAQLPITAFIPALAGYGQDTQRGMAAEFLEAIANTANQYGQALVGALREGRNTAGLNSSGIKADNAVPQQSPTVPPQAALGDANYTPAQARAQI